MTLHCILHCIPDQLVTICVESIFASTPLLFEWSRYTASVLGSASQAGGNVLYSCTAGCQELRRVQDKCIEALPS